MVIEVSIYGLIFMHFVYLTFIAILVSMIARYMKRYDSLYANYIYESKLNSMLYDMATKPVCIRDKKDKE